MCSPGAEPRAGDLHGFSHEIYVTTHPSGTIITTPHHLTDEETEALRGQNDRTKVTELLNGRAEV